MFSVYTNSFCSSSSETSVVCISCHTLLVKIEKFKQLIKKSIHSSVEYTKNTAKTVPLLKRTPVCIVSIVPISSKNQNAALPIPNMLKTRAEEPKHQKKEEKNNKKPLVDKLQKLEDTSEDDSGDIEIKQEVRSDDEDFIRVSTVVKVEPIMTLQPASESEVLDHTKTESSSIPLEDDLYSGKIGIVTLTPEQVLEELETSKKHPAYADKDFKCDSCAIGFLSKRTLDIHMQKHDEGEESTKIHFCADCKTVYKNQSCLTLHLKMHSKHVDKEARVTCHDCGSQFRNKVQIQRHIYKKHMPINKCHFCSKVFSMSRYLKKHIEHVHLGKKAPRNKMCQYCGKAFTVSYFYVYYT
ncbi:hypothetical protein K1T71_015199 [Dendrolimus kikuchii]|nr:hypothetical protein K1T71_015199 [Dendrolimus kikuchii]